jgi:hypothetical protein
MAMMEFVRVNRIGLLMGSAKELLKEIFMGQGLSQTSYSQ